MPSTALGKLPLRCLSFQVPMVLYEEPALIALKRSHIAFALYFTRCHRPPDEQNNRITLVIRFELKIVAPELHTDERRRLIFPAEF